MLQLLVPYLTAEGHTEKIMPRICFATESKDYAAELCEMARPSFQRPLHYCEGMER